MVAKSSMSLYPVPIRLPVGKGLSTEKASRHGAFALRHEFGAGSNRYPERGLVFSNLGPNRSIDEGEIPPVDTRTKRELAAAREPLKTWRTRASELVLNGVAGISLAVCRPIARSRSGGWAAMFPIEKTAISGRGVSMMRALARSTLADWRLRRRYMPASKQMPRLWRSDCASALFSVTRVYSRNTSPRYRRE